MDSELDRKADRLLTQSQVWRLNSYGWLNENDVDPEFIGHAMWQSDPPIGYERFFWSQFCDKDMPPPPTAPERQQLAAVTGADFEGLMAWARLSIGMFLVQLDNTREKDFSDDTLLELHQTSATIYLSMASDRLRDFFIIAAFGHSFDAYKAERGGQGLKGGVPYTEAFQRALAQNGTHPEVDTFQKAATLADAVRELRDRRNEIIHELATEAAKRERAWQEELRQVDHLMDFGSVQKAAAAAREARQRRLTAIVCELTGWYELLVRLSNEIFIIENKLRPGSWTICNRPA